jgi:hypothetical protein
MWDVVMWRDEDIDSMRLGYATAERRGDESDGRQNILPGIYLEGHRVQTGSLTWLRRKRFCQGHPYTRISMYAQMNSMQ